MLPYRLTTDNVACRSQRLRPLAARTANGVTFAWKAPRSATSRSIVELKLEVWDSPNSAGVVIDAVRCLKLALDRGLTGPLIGPSSYFMKSPPEQYKDEVALQMTEAYIRGENPEQGTKDDEG